MVAVLRKTGVGVVLQLRLVYYHPFQEQTAASQDDLAPSRC